MRWILLLALLLAGCNLVEQPTRMLGQANRDWREIATSADRERLRDWRDTFVKALAAARAGGQSAKVDREGALLEPDAALAGAAIPNGRYRCRTIKLGAKSPGMLDYVAYPGFTCRISARESLQKFVKLSGSQRQVGIIFPSDGIRQVFLGTVALSDEGEALQYGIDERRNVVGYVERIGPARWRLIMPKPAFESQLDILELVPTAPGA